MRRDPWTYTKPLVTLEVLLTDGSAGLRAELLVSYPGRENMVTYSWDIASGGLDSAQYEDLTSLCTRLVADEILTHIGIQGFLPMT
jgi:hypothetical protein